MSRTLNVCGHYRNRDALLNHCYRHVVRCFHRKPAKLLTNSPIVSFTFDDFPLSAHTSGAQILKQFGACGTYYACLDSQLAREPEFTGAHADVIARLVADGHQIGCHTFDHLDCGLGGSLAIREAIVRNRAALGQIIPDYDLCSFAYPFGNVSIEAKEVIGRLFESARGIVSGINVGTIDVAQLRAHELREEGKSLSRAHQLIERNRQANGWLIFFTHEVASNPGIHGLTPESFRRVVERAAASGAVLATVKDAMRRMVHAETL